MCYDILEHYRCGHSATKRIFCITAVSRRLACQVSATDTYHMSSVAQPYGCGEAARVERLFWAANDNAGYQAWFSYARELLQDDPEMCLLKRDKDARMVYARETRFDEFCQMMEWEYCRVAEAKKREEGMAEQENANGEEVWATGEQDEQ